MHQYQSGTLKREKMKYSQSSSSDLSYRNFSEKEDQQRRLSRFEREEYNRPRDRHLMQTSSQYQQRRESSLIEEGSFTRRERSSVREDYQAQGHRRMRSLDRDPRGIEESRSRVSSYHEQPRRERSRSRDYQSRYYQSRYYQSRDRHLMQTSSQSQLNEGRTQGRERSRDHESAKRHREYEQETSLRYEKKPRFHEENQWLLIFNKVCHLSRNKFELNNYFREKINKIINLDPSEIENPFHVALILNKASKVNCFYQLIQEWKDNQNLEPILNNVASNSLTNHTDISLILNALSKIQDYGNSVFLFHQKINDTKWEQIISQANSQEIANIFNALSKIQDYGNSVFLFHQKINEKGGWEKIILQANSQEIANIFNALSKIQDGSKYILSFHQNIDKDKWKQIISQANSQVIANIFNALSKIQDGSKYILSFNKKINEKSGWEQIISQANTQNIANIFNALSKIQDGSKYILSFHQNIDKDKWKQIISQANSQVIANIFNALSKIQDGSKYILSFHQNIDNDKWKQIISQSNTQDIANIFNALSKIQDGSKYILSFNKKINEKSGWEQIISQANTQNIANIFNALSKIQDDGNAVFSFHQKINEKGGWEQIISQANSQEIANIFNALSKIQDDGNAVFSFHQEIDDSKWKQIISQSNTQDIANIFNALSKIQDDGNAVFSFHQKINEKGGWEQIISQANSQEIANIFNALSKIKGHDSIIKNFFEKIDNDKRDEILKNSNIVDLAMIFVGIADNCDIDRNFKLKLVERYHQLKKDGDILEFSYTLKLKFFKKLGNFQKMTIQSDDQSVIESSESVELASSHQSSTPLIASQQQEIAQNTSAFKGFSLYFSEDETEEELVIDGKIFSENDTELLPCKSLSEVKEYSSLSTAQSCELVEIKLTPTGQLTKDTLSKFNYLNKEQLKNLKSLALLKNIREVLAGNSLLYTGDFFNSDIGESLESLTLITKFEDGQHTIILKEIVTKFLTEENSLLEFLTENNLLNSDYSLRKLLKKSDLEVIDSEHNKLLDSLIEKGFLLKTKNEEFIVFNDEPDNLKRLKEHLGEGSFKDLIKIISKIKIDQNLIEFGNSSDKEKINEILRSINNPCNNFVRYYDPNNSNTTCEINWLEFEKQISAKKKVTGVYKTARSIQYQETKSIEQTGSTCFLVALLCLSENDQALRNSIEFIHQKESEILCQRNETLTNIDQAFKEELSDEKKEEYKKEFKKRGYILGDDKFSLINILNDKDDPKNDKFLKEALDIGFYKRLDEFYLEYQNSFLLSSIFVLNTYLDCYRKDLDEVPNNELLYKRFREKSSVNHDSIDVLSSKLMILYKRIGKIHGLDTYKYNCKVDLDKTSIPDLPPVKTSICI